MNSLKEIYQYRELLKSNVRKDIRGRYKGSFLGVLWTFINPLLQVLVYFIVFPILMRSSMEHYLIYLVTGLLPWMFFQATIVAGTQSIKSNAGIVKKVYFPRQILVLSQVISGLVNFLITIPIILIFCAVESIPFTWHLIWIPLIAIIQSLLLYGADLILSAINVYVQDVENIINFFLNMLFYGTPIIYSIDQFESMKGTILYKLIEYNPMTIIVNSYRNVIMYDANPAWKALGAVFLLAIVLIVIGNMVFNRLQRGFAEEL
jgi:ABC-2 type transport system permease protein